MVFQAKARSYNQQTLVVGCISNKKSMKKPPAGICPMRPSRPGVDFYKLILHFFYVLNGLINNTSLDIRSICQVIPQMISGWPFTHSWFRQYFRSNLYGRAPRGPRGVIKSDFIFQKWKCWVFALRLPQKGTNCKNSGSWRIFWHPWGPWGRIHLENFKVLVFVFKFGHS